MTPTKINQELLEALKLFVEYEQACSNGDDVGSMLAYAEFSEQAHAAIANAERAQTQADDLDSRVRAAEGQQ